jgi:ankyrin repeat protein
MKELASEGADFNLVDYRGRGPIHIAAIAGNMEMIEFLIQQRVNLDFID